jgi:hypothetical protein
MCERVHSLLTWLVLHQNSFPGRRRFPVLLQLLAVLLAVVVLSPRPDTVHADTTTCQLTGPSTTCPNLAPPALLNLNQPLYAATAAQSQSLQTLETQAVTNTIQDHGLGGRQFG